MAILVAGGAGYIGSHTCVELLERGYEVVVVDNLYNSSEVALERVQEITGKTLKFYKGDILNREDLEPIFENEEIEAVINFAGLKAVGESVEKPWEYYHNNITGTLILCDVMRKHGCKNMIFSSSATVYGDPAEIPITEKCPKGEITNPYGRTKGMLEQILTDLHTGWNRCQRLYPCSRSGDRSCKSDRENEESERCSHLQPGNRRWIQRTGCRESIRKSMRQGDSV